MRANLTLKTSKVALLRGRYSAHHSLVIVPELSSFIANHQETIGSDYSELISTRVVSSKLFDAIIYAPSMSHYVTITTLTTLLKVFTKSQKKSHWENYYGNLKILDLRLWEKIYFRYLHLLTSFSAILLYLLTAWQVFIQQIVSKF